MDPSNNFGGYNSRPSTTDNSCSRGIKNLFFIHGEMVFQQFTMPSEGNDWRLTLVIWPMIIAGAKLMRIGTLAPTTTHNMVDGILGEATKWAIIRCICQPTLQAM
jgi:hypothetical protein